MKHALYAVWMLVLMLELTALAYCIYRAVSANHEESDHD